MQKWRVSEQLAETQLYNLEGDCLLAASMVCYLGAFTQKKRRYLFEKWTDLVAHSGIYHTERMNFNNTYCDKIEIKNWLDCGLPNDSMSIENAIILNHSMY